MNFRSLPVFEKELKKYLKKYPSLREDLEVFKKTFASVELGNNKRFVILREDISYKIIKTRLACKCLKGSDKTRLIVAVAVCEEEVTFLELYFKMNKEREDQERIEEFLRF